MLVTICVCVFDSDLEKRCNEEKEENEEKESELWQLDSSSKAANSHFVGFNRVIVFIFGLFFFVKICKS